MRLLAILSALLIAAPTLAQTPCIDNEAGGYDCNRVGLWAVLPISTFSVPGSPAPNRMNDVWGWTHEASGREFALAGTENGVGFVEITDPAAPVFLGKLPTQTTSTTWRDVKTYGDYAFVVSEAGGHGMQVFDLTRLLNVQNPPQAFTADALYTGFGSAHNVVIDPEAGLAAGVGVNASTCGGGGLHLVDITAPLTPTYAGCFDDDGYTHDAQCVTYAGPDTDYTGHQICVGSNTDTITISDVTDPANAVQLSRGFYPNPGYTHQGWFTEDQRYFIVNDELDDGTGFRTIIFDLADLDAPTFEFFHIRSLETTDHNLYVRGDYAYLSNYEGGLRIHDISQIGINRFDLVGYFDTYPQGNGTGFSGQWSNYPFFASGVVLANDRQNGLFILAPDPSFFSVSAEDPVEVPEAGYLLSEGTPNPFADAVAFDLAVDAAQHVRVEAYDVQGRRVATLLDRVVTANQSETVTLRADDLPAGTYVIRVTGERFSATRSVVLAR